MQIIAVRLLIREIGLHYGLAAGRIQINLLKDSQKSKPQVASIKSTQFFNLIDKSIKPLALYDNRENLIMCFYNKIRQKSVDTKEVWTELIRSESQISEDDVIQSFRHFREMPRKSQQHKNDLAYEELCQNIVQTLRDILRGDEDPQGNDLIFLNSIKSNAKYPFLWNSIDLILKFQKFSRILQSNKYILLHESLPVLQLLLPSMSDFKNSDYQLYMVSKMYLIISIFYLNLYGVTMKERMHKLVRKSLSLRQHLHQKWQKQMSILQLPIYVAHSYVKLLWLKKFDRDYLKKLLFTLKKNLAKLLYKRRDMTLEAINRQVSGIAEQLCAEPQIYNEALSVAIKRSNSLYNFSTAGTKRSKIMSVNSNVVTVMSMIKKHRQISASKLSKVTHVVMNNLKSSKNNMVLSRKQPQDRLKVNSVDFEQAQLFFQQQKKITFKMFFQGKVIQLFSKILIHKTEERINCSLQIQLRPAGINAFVSLKSVYFSPEGESPKLSSKQILLNSLKKLFPLSNEKIYLPLVRSDLSDLQCYQRACQSSNQKISNLHLGNINHVKFISFIKDLIIQGCRSSMMFSDKLIGSCFQMKKTDKKTQQIDLKHRRRGKYLSLVGDDSFQDEERKWLWRGIIKNAGYEMLIIKQLEREKTLVQSWVRLAEEYSDCYMTLIIQQIKKDISQLHENKNRSSYSYYSKKIIYLINKALEELGGSQAHLDKCYKQNITIDHELPIDQAYPAVDIKYQIPDQATQTKKQQIYRLINKGFTKILSRRKILLGKKLVTLITEVYRNQFFYIVKIHQYNTFIKLPVKTTLSKYDFQLLRLQMYTRVFAMKKGRPHIILAQTKPSVFFNYTYEYQKRNFQLCITKLGYDCVFQVLKTSIVKVNNIFRVINVYTSQGYYIYEIYDPASSQKAFGKSLELFQNYKLDNEIKILNGVRLEYKKQRYQRDIRYCFCEAKGYYDTAN